MVQVLEELGLAYTLVKYLETPLTKKELQALLALLHIPAMDLIRTKEPIFQSEYGNTRLTEAKAIAALVKFPILMERPIVVNGSLAVIARPAERVHEIL